MTNSNFSKASEVLKKYELKSDKYISREFQDYGLALAEELGDIKHKALYIKLAKQTPRGYLESARAFVKDARNAKNPAALFMWKLTQLKKAKK